MRGLEHLDLVCVAVHEPAVVLRRQSGLDLWQQLRQRAHRERLVSFKEQRDVEVIVVRDELARAPCVDEQSVQPVGRDGGTPGTYRRPEACRTR